MTTTTTTTTEIATLESQLASMRKTLAGQREALSDMADDIASMTHQYCVRLDRLGGEDEFAARLHADIDRWQANYTRKCASVRAQADRVKRLAARIALMRAKSA